VVWLDRQDQGVNAIRSEGDLVGFKRKPTEAKGLTRVTIGEVFTGWHEKTGKVQEEHMGGRERGEKPYRMRFWLIFF